MVDDLRALLDELQLEKVDLIGHSVGGKVAMAFSEQYPDSVNKLIVVDIAPRQYLPEHNAIFKALLALDLEQYYKRSALDQALAVTLPNKAVRQFLLMNISSKNESLQWQINLPALWTNYSYLLAEVCRSTNIAIPSCFVVGGKSNYITNDDHALIHSLFSNVSIITVEQAGHWVHAEAPAEFIRLVNEFFNYD